MIPDEDGEAHEYFSCPLLWFRTPIMDFFEMKKYLEKYPHTAVPFEERRPRYVAFEKYYTSTLQDFEEAKAQGGVEPIQAGE